MPGLVLVGIVLAIVAAACVLLVALSTHARYRGLLLVGCPETGEECWVGFDASRAALSSCFGRRSLAVLSCSRWPLENRCPETCASLPETAMRPARVGG